MAYLRSIQNDEEHQSILREIEGLMNAQAGSSDGDRLDALATLVEVYEACRWPIEAEA